MQIAKAKYKDKLCVNVYGVKVAQKLKGAKKLTKF